mgnify:FL=1
MFTIFLIDIINPGKIKPFLYVMQMPIEAVEAHLEHNDCRGDSIQSLLELCKII